MGPNDGVDAEAKGADARLLTRGASTERAAKAFTKSMTLSCALTGTNTRAEASPYLPEPGLRPAPERLPPCCLVGVDVFVIVNLIFRRLIKFIRKRADKTKYLKHLK
jgi:hypothetical protein